MRTASPSRASPQLAWMDGVREVSPASQDAQVIVWFPIILKTVAGVPRLRMCPHPSAPGRLQIEVWVGLPPAHCLQSCRSQERRPADRPGLNSGSSETDPNLRDPECLGQGCHNSTQSRVIDDGHD